MTTAMITLRTLHYPYQASRIMESIQKQEGVLKDSVYVWFSYKQVVVTFDESKINIDDVIATLEKLGHPIFKFRLYSS